MKYMEWADLKPGDKVRLSKEMRQTSYMWASEPCYSKVIFTITRIFIEDLILIYFRDPYNKEWNVTLEKKSGGLRLYNYVPFFELVELGEE